MCVMAMYRRASCGQTDRVTCTAGVLSLQMVGAPGMVVDLGLLDGRCKVLRPTCWRWSGAGRLAFELGMAELVAHTGLGYLPGMLSMLGTLELMMVALNSQPGVVAEYELEDVSNITGRT